MEYWEYKADDGLILQTDPCRPYKKRSQSTKPSIPAFQYSIIPLPLAADSRHSRGALTWPRGPGFLRQNKRPKKDDLIEPLRPIRSSINQSNSCRLLFLGTAGIAATTAGRPVLYGAFNVLVVINHLGQQTGVVEPVGILPPFIQVIGKAGQNRIIQVLVNRQAVFKLFVEVTIEPAHKLKIDQNKLQNCRSNILNLVNVL